MFPQTNLIPVVDTSFSKPIQKELIAEKKDTTHGMIRTEVRSKTGDAHLGHVFTDGQRTKADCGIVSIVLRCVLSRKKNERRRIWRISAAH